MKDKKLWLPITLLAGTTCLFLLYKILVFVSFALQEGFNFPVLCRIIDFKFLLLGIVPLLAIMITALKVKNPKILYGIGIFLFVFLNLNILCMICDAAEFSDFSMEHYVKFREKYLPLLNLFSTGRNIIFSIKSRYPFFNKVLLQVPLIFLFPIIASIFLSAIYSIGKANGNESFDSTPEPAPENEKVNLIQAVKKAFVNYFNLTGCASHSEYWFFVLFKVIIYASIIILAFVTHLVLEFFHIQNDSRIFFIVLFLTEMLTFIPGICVQVRRTHDAGFSGWFYFCPSFRFIVLFLPSKKDSKYTNKTITNNFNSVLKKFFAFFGMYFILVPLNFTFAGLIQNGYFSGRATPAVYGIDPALCSVRVKKNAFSNESLYKIAEYCGITDFERYPMLSIYNETAEISDETYTEEKIEFNYLYAGDYPLKEISATLKYENFEGEFVEDKIVIPVNCKKGDFVHIAFPYGVKWRDELDNIKLCYQDGTFDTLNTMEEASISIPDTLHMWTTYGDSSFNIGDNGKINLIANIKISSRAEKKYAGNVEIAIYKGNELVSKEKYNVYESDYSLVVWDNALNYALEGILSIKELEEATLIRITLGDKEIKISDEADIDELRTMLKVWKEFPYEQRFDWGKYFR